METCKLENNIYKLMSHVNIELKIFQKKNTKVLCSVDLVQIIEILEVGIV